MMEIRDVMTTDVRLVDPDTTLKVMLAEVKRLADYAARHQSGPHETLPRLHQDDPLGQCVRRKYRPAAHR